MKENEKVEENSFIPKKKSKLQIASPFVETRWEWAGIKESYKKYTSSQDSWANKISNILILNSSQKKVMSAGARLGARGGLGVNQRIKN